MQASIFYQLKFLMKCCIIRVVVNIVAVINTKLLYMASSAGLGRMLRSLFRSPIVLLTLFNIVFKCSSKDKRLSRIMPNCFCELASDTHTVIVQK